MKLKKILVVLFTCVMLLTMSSSVFANEITPFAAGFADTIDKAHTLTPNKAGIPTFSMSLSNAQDKDWYKWTNTTGEGRYISSLFLTDNQSKYIMGNKVVYGNGKETNVFYNEYDDGRLGVISNIYVPPNGTIYLVIESLEFVSPSDVYTIYFIDHDLG